MVADTTYPSDGHAPCAETILRVRPGRSAGLSAPWWLSAPRPKAGLFFARTRRHGTRATLEV